MTEPAATTSGTYWLRLAAAAFLTATFVSVQFLWFNELFARPDPAEALLRDWFVFLRTGQHVAAGRWAEIYPVDRLTGDWVTAADGYYFLYPPFFAWITLPLGSLSLLAAYLACVLAVVTTTLLATFGILRALKANAVQRLFAGLATVASAAWNSAVFVGNLSAGLVLSPGLALLAWSGRRPVLAGGALAILLAKPNWGIPIGAFILFGRRWKMAGGFGIGALVLVLTTLPLGSGPWTDWFHTMVGVERHGTGQVVTEAGLADGPVDHSAITGSQLTEDESPSWKQVTLLATIGSLSGRSGSSRPVLVAWLFAAIPLLGATAIAWFRRGDAHADFPRLLGVALLAILVANPYAYFYDAIMPLPLAIVLWTQRDRYRSQALRDAARYASIFAFVWMHLQIFVLMERAPSLTGLALAFWLLFELADLLRSPAALSPRPRSGRRPISGHRT